MVSKLDLYKVFCQVGQAKSFSKAAQQLYMTQPAVSQAIQQMEKELQTILFNRTPRGVTFTAEGQVLYEYAQSALNLLDTGEEKMEEFQNLSAGELKIGVGDTISRHFLLPYLEEFHTRFPNIKFKIINGTTAELCAIVKLGEVDIALCNLPFEDEQLEMRSLMKIHDVFVAGEKYFRYCQNPITFEQLIQFPLIFLEPNANSRRYVERYLERKGVTLAPEFELGSYELVLDFATINLGIACVTREFSTAYLSTGQLIEVPLQDPIPARSIGVCYLKTVTLSPASRKFIELIEYKMADTSAGK